MGIYDFTYALPNDFNNRVYQLLQQLYKSNELANAFANCRYEYEDLGLAYYAGLKGCLLYTSPSPRDPKTSRMPSSA